LLLIYLFIYLLPACLFAVVRTRARGCVAITDQCDLIKRLTVKIEVNRDKSNLIKIKSKTNFIYLFKTTV